MFVHLHGHSHYSLLGGVGTPQNIIKKALQLNMTSIAITDYGGMYGALEFYEIAKKNSIKPILGVELPITKSYDKNIKQQDLGNIVLLAKDNTGYKSLLQITSLAHIETPFDTPCITISNLKNYKGVVYILSASNSILSKMILNNESEAKIIETISILQNLSENNLYFELIAQDHKKNPQIQQVNQNLIMLSKKLNIPMILGNNFHYIEKDDKVAYEVLLCIKDGLKFENRPNIKQDLHIMSEDEIVQIMAENGFKQDFINSLIENNKNLADQINIEIELGKILFPKYESPQHIKDLYEKLKDDLVLES